MGELTTIKLSEIPDGQTLKIKQIFKLAGFDSSINESGTVSLWDNYSKDSENYSERLKFKTILEAASMIQPYLNQIHFNIVA